MFFLVNRTQLALLPKEGLLPVQTLGVGEGLTVFLGERFLALNCLDIFFSKLKIMRSKMSA